MKYALIENNKVKLISYVKIDGFIEVSDNVFADMVKKEDGTFDYTDEFKNLHLADNSVEESKKASGKQKLKDLGLDDDEIKALMGA
jgi:hypothetical protein